MEKKNIETTMDTGRSHINPFQISLNEIQKSINESAMLQTISSSQHRISKSSLSKMQYFNESNRTPFISLIQNNE
jgi:hypothetical protein